MIWKVSFDKLKYAGYHSHMMNQLRVESSDVLLRLIQKAPAKLYIRGHYYHEDPLADKSRLEIIKCLKAAAS